MTVVREERRLGDVAGVGEVTVSVGPPVTADQRAAAARAWLSVARTLQAAGAGEEAYVAARSGIEELGDAYVDPEVDDDTTMKLLAAEDAHDRGLDHAASAIVRVLENRLAVFVEGRKGRSVAPPLDS